MASRNSSDGNVLFIILIAVAIFGALAYAVVSGGKGQKASLSAEQARIAATEMIQFGDSIRIATDKMIAVGGVADTAATLFAATDAHADYGVSGTTPSDEVFHPDGGGINYDKPPSAACSSCVYDFTGQIAVTGVGDTATYDLAMMVLDVSATLCRQINSVQATGLATIPTGAAIATQDRFAGSYGGGNGITLAGAMTGLRSFCYQESSGAERHIFVHVVRGR